MDCLFLTFFLNKKIIAPTGERWNCMDIFQFQVKKKSTLMQKKLVMQCYEMVTRLPMYYHISSFVLSPIFFWNISFR